MENLNKFIELLINGTKNQVETFIYDYNIDKKYDILYYAVKFADLKMIKFLINRFNLDVEKKYEYNNKTVSILDLAKIWRREDDIIRYFMELKILSKDKYRVGNIYFYKNFISKNDEKYEYYLNKFNDVLHKNTNFMNFEELRGIKIEGDDGYSYDLLRFVLCNGVMDQNKISDFDLLKAKIVISKNIVDYSYVLDFIYKNFNKFKDRNKIVRILNILKKMGVSYNFKKFVDTYNLEEVK